MDNLKVFFTVSPIISHILDRVRADGKLDVFNGQRLIFPDGKPSNATGFVFNPDPSEPGKWKVQIQNRQRIGPPGDCKCKFLF